MSNYAGDIDTLATWTRLSQHQDSILIDVRTQAEWAFVGIPDLQKIGKSPIFLEWQFYPTMQVNPDFSSIIAEQVIKLGGSKESELYFLCRSGARSQSAAASLTNLGFSNCFNVTEGFEGPMDKDSHRGKQDGWKAKGLPWIQK